MEPLTVTMRLDTSEITEDRLRTLAAEHTEDEIIAALRMDVASEGMTLTAKAHIEL